MSRSGRTLLSLFAMGMAVVVSSGLARAQSAPQADPAQAQPPQSRQITAQHETPRHWAVGAQGGLAMAALRGEVTVRAPFGLLLGVGGGARIGPSVDARVAYDLPIDARTSLRPGVRVARLWMPQDAGSCTVSRCIYDFAVVEAAIHHRLGRGLWMEVGIPLAGFVPSSTDPGQTRAPLSFHSLATTPEILFLSTLMLGWNFDL